MRSLHLSLCLLAAAACSLAQQNRGYYRFPAISGNTIAFTSEGDLWVTGIDGGMARRLTTHPGDETHAAFSPDGKTIAFSANYEGPTEVYTMPADGGLPTRRTFEGGATVVGWTPDGKILYSTRRYSTLPNDQLATIAPDNRIALVPLSQAAQGVYDPQGRTLFFTRLPFQGSQAKRYQGGTAQNIWKFAGDQEAVPLTSDFAGTSKDAMFWNGRVYFLSDRDGTMNLWSMDANGHNLKQLTRHQGWDAQSAALSQGRIVYQLGADLHLYDIAAGSDKALTIELPSDFDHLRERWIKTPLEFTTSLHISQDGANLVATSRGRVFVIPAKNGRLVDVTERKPGRYRDARMMPDGKSVLALSTETGETEFWKLPANGAGTDQQLTQDAKVLRWDGVPSPDGKWIAHQDKDNQLWLLETATKADKKIDVSMHGDNSSPQFQPVRWSPDSRWLTYTRPGANQFDQVFLYSVESGQLTPLTTDRYNSEDAAWSADGKWIYLLSDRSLKTIVLAPWGSRAPDPYFDRPMKIYQIALRKGLRSPFTPPDELHPDKPEESAKKSRGIRRQVARKSPRSKSIWTASRRASKKFRRRPAIIASLTAGAKRLCWINRNPSEPTKSAPPMHGHRQQGRQARDAHGGRAQLRALRRRQEDAHPQAERSVRAGCSGSRIGVEDSEDPRRCEGGSERLVVLRYPQRRISRRIPRRLAPASRLFL